GHRRGGVSLQGLQSPGGCPYLSNTSHGTRGHWGGYDSYASQYRWGDPGAGHLYRLSAPDSVAPWVARWRLLLEHRVRGPLAGSVSQGAHSMPQRRAPGGTLSHGEP